MEEKTIGINFIGTQMRYIMTLMVNKEYTIGVEVKLSEEDLKIHKDVFETLMSDKATELTNKKHKIELMLLEEKRLK